MTQTFPKEQRVVHRVEFTRIIRKGACAADDTLVMFALPTTADQPPRLGVTIPVKTGNAVIRNRWKRLIRESFRTRQDSIPRGYDFVVRPKKDADLSWEKVRNSVTLLTRNAVERSKSSR